MSVKFVVLGLDEAAAEELTSLIGVVARRSSTNDSSTMRHWLLGAITLLFKALKRHAIAIVALEYSEGRNSRVKDKIKI